jgi:AhpD family alkylhydroperoxidase
VVVEDLVVLYDHGQGEPNEFPPRRWKFFFWGNQNDNSRGEFKNPFEGVSFRERFPSIRLERRRYIMKLDERTMRLIAVGASITANCQPCLEINVAKALENGADKQEIVEAIEVGKTVRKGATSKMDRFAQSQNYAIPSSVSMAESGCGCGQ